MTDYLSLTKILRDSVALYRRHFIYLTILVCGVTIPAFFLDSVEAFNNSPLIQNGISLFFTILSLLVQFVAINLVATSYVDKEVNLFDQFKLGSKKVIPLLFISYLSLLVTLLGIVLMVFPGILAMMFYDVYVVDFVTSNRSFKESFNNTYKLFNFKRVLKILKIYMIPVVVLFIIVLFVYPIGISLEEVDIMLNNFYPYLTVLSILIFPLSIVFKTAIYYNLIKEGYKDLKPTNEFV